MCKHRVQHHTAQLDLSLTPLELLQRTFPTAKVDELRGHLGRYGLTADLAVQNIGAQSWCRGVVLSWCGSRGVVVVVV